MRGTGALLAGLLAGCDLIGPDDCTLELRPAFEVTVVDARSGALLSHGATVTIREGTFTETLQRCGGDGGVTVTLCGVHERAGTYSVVVEHPGYQSWLRTGVKVTETGCHVRTQRLTVELVEVGGG